MIKNIFHIALLHTGAGKNFIRKDLVPTKSPLIAKPGNVEYAISNFSSKSSGIVKLEIKIEGRTFNVEFIVMPDLREELSLECPWLGKNGGILDLERRCLFIGQTPHLTVHWHGYKSVVTSEEILQNLKAEQLSSEGCEKVVVVVREPVEVFAESQQQYINKSVTRNIVLIKG